MGFSFDLPEGVTPIFANELEVTQGTAVGEERVQPLLFVTVTDNEQGTYAIPLPIGQASELAEQLLQNVNELSAEWERQDDE